jgi:ureidoglycolate lyase
MRPVVPGPLTPEAFAPYGDVIDYPHSLTGKPANGGTALRFDGIAGLVLTAEGGTPELSYLRASPASLPFTCEALERHPLSSQLFMPVRSARFLVVVALGDLRPEAFTMRSFITEPGQGVNYAPGTWHHALIAIDRQTDFLVLGRSRARPEEDLDIFILDPEETFALGLSDCRR